MKSNRAAALGILLVAIPFFIAGLNVMLHIDSCGGRVMHQGNLCPNTSGRPRNSWVNDYQHQQQRNRRVGVGLMGGSSAMFLAAGVLAVYGDLNVCRIVTRRSAARRADRLSRDTDLSPTGDDPEPQPPSAQ